MQSSRQTAYGALPVVDDHQMGAESKIGSVPDYPEEKPQRRSQPRPQTLDKPWVTRCRRVIVDLVLAALALLFGVFGLWAYSVNGSTAGPGSTGVMLVRVSQYAPTIFPVLFAAIAGATMKSVASWRMQASQGATLGSLEQCLGSQTISRAFTTQINLRTYNLLGLSIVALWCLSPLGSQASLRVISVIPKSEIDLRMLSTVDTFGDYSSDYTIRTVASEGGEVVEMTVPTAVVTSLMAVKFLMSRNQDIWGNVRLPAIENLEKGGKSGGDSGWIELLGHDPIEYASLIGTPVANLATKGNTSFVLPGSYLSLSCPTIRLVSNQTVLSNWTSNPPAIIPELHENRADCEWAIGKSALPQYQVAISRSCGEPKDQVITAERVPNARKLIWESNYLLDNYDYEKIPPVISRAECDMTTTHTETQVTCIESLSGDSSGSICNPRAVRRSPNPPFHGNWTVFDKSYGTDAPVLESLTNLFPLLAFSNFTRQPVLVYLTNPFRAVGGDDLGPVYNTTDRATFELSLAQIFNSILYVGIDGPTFTGSFNRSDPDRGTRSSHYNGSTRGGEYDHMLNITGDVTSRHDVVYCDRAWLGVLIISSLAAFLCAIAGAVLRMMTLTPDVLDSTSIALLHNRVGGLEGSSGWLSDEWVRHFKDARLRLGDVEPAAEVGRIGLATLDDGAVGVVKSGRYYN
ncbi:hypothetical protein CH63R_03761 [Colletotrichum higginsianum IMI 349063]|uniref:Uncharacterized protein n=1 Tax=Colletotrichum higginsianum (strain IMI 349063) TaxID=759273 RepID=A0A1B7YHJ6_COLHI|nr:hypothetical protein CH63R_03761 [Colletotrichum higginsianum IMI 349063]OBR11465.1 hypothetical protein CH63R_03761 [Colletotrichum higginsianum IMI 349063]